MERVAFATSFASALFTVGVAVYKTFLGGPPYLEDPPSCRTGEECACIEGGGPVVITMYGTLAIIGLLSKACTRKGFGDVAVDRAMFEVCAQGARAVRFFGPLLSLIFFFFFMGLFVVASFVPVCGDSAALWAPFPLFIVVGFGSNAMIALVVASLCWDPAADALGRLYLLLFKVTELSIFFVAIIDALVDRDWLSLSFGVHPL